MDYEYKTIEAAVPASAEHLTELSQRGWELVNTLYVPEPHRKVYTHLRRERPNRDANNEGDWYCPACEVEVDPRNVTHEERHDDCGTPVTRT